MPSVEFMELADEMGFLVDSEAFDMWGHTKTKYDYGRFFAESAKKDVESWIRRDRNHPSIIMWSVGNEIYDMHAGDEGLAELVMLLGEVKKHDPKKHAFTTFASNYMRWENTQKCAGLVDAVGYNYGEYLYEEHHAKHPDWVIYGSETSSMLASRGVYHFPIETSTLCDTDEQCSALGNCSAGWGAHSYTDNIIADRDAGFSLGQFIWAGVDYFGEPTPYHTRNSYFGQIHTLNIGDKITLTTKLGTRTYQVTDVSKVSETDRSGLADSGENMLTLYTCVRNQRDQRWCVTAVEA